MLKKVLRLSGSGAGSLRRLRAAGDEAQRRQDWPQSVDFYKKYLRRRPDDGPIWVQFGHALKELKRLNEAELAYRSALRIAPNDEDASLHLTSLLHVLGRKQEVIASEATLNAALKTKIELQNQNKYSVDMTNRQKGDVARDCKNWYAAALFYSEHLDEQPGDGPIWVQLGHMLKEQSLLDESLYAYRAGQHLETEPSDVSLHISFLMMHLGYSMKSEPLWASMFELEGIKR